VFSHRAILQSGSCRREFFIGKRIASPRDKNDSPTGGSLIRPLLPFLLFVPNRVSVYLSVLAAAYVK